LFLLTATHEKEVGMKLGVVVVAGMAVLFGSGQIAAAADGKAVYDKSCGGCHNAMAPKLGDKAAWGPLAKKGADALVASVVKGKGAMPPKGGAASLSDADIKAAVEYIVSRAK
jgi:cytochrome c5